jgi:[acyl-carrier-protein] S-malonyltransferase
VETRTLEDWRALLEAEKTLDSGVYNKHDLLIVRGQGARVWDAEGNEYIDCVGGYGVANLGHGNPEVVEAVNFNDPNQTVIAGSKTAVEQAMAVIKAAGAKRALPLPVSAPFHSSLMRPAAEKLATHLASVSLLPPQIPVLNNIDVAAPTDPIAIKDALVRQAFGPVRWVESVQTLASNGVTKMVECGPGKVLTGMVKRIAPTVVAVCAYDPPSLAEALAA